MKFLKLPTLMVLFFIQACATAPLDKVPQVPCADFEALDAGSLKSRTVAIEVKNMKQVNQTAGNSSEVAGKFSDTLQCIAEKGGFQVTPNSPNRWLLTITDCEPSANPKEVAAKSPSATKPEQTSCVKMKSEFSNPDFKYFGESTASQGYVFGNPNYVLNRRMDEAYRDALRGIMRKMNEKLRQ